jgi:predicted metal-dependent enzyme (double-stranded beta helix superfamily)
MKLLYKPLNLIVSALGGVLAGIVFRQSWKVISGEDEAPKATSTDHAIREVLLAAALQGAIFGVAKAAVDRGGAVAYRKATGKKLED